MYSGYFLFLEQYGVLSYTYLKRTQFCNFKSLYIVYFLTINLISRQFLLVFSRKQKIEELYINFKTVMFDN